MTVETSSAHLQRELAVAVEAVRKAAVLCAAVQSQIDAGVLEKKDRSPVTVADFGSQALVCKRLSESFPDDEIVGEEDSQALQAPENAHLMQRVVKEVRKLLPDAEANAIRNWIDRGAAEGGPKKRFWTLDPIDGTKGFIRREQYAVALALIENGQPIVAAMACPNLGRSEDGMPGVIFSAVAGQGAAVQLIAGDQSESISVSDVDDPAQARICESVDSGHTDTSWRGRIAARLGVTAESVRLDSQAKYGVVATANAELYLRLPVKPGYVECIWDHAAGALIAMEAGGQVTDIRGRPLDFGLGKRLNNNQGVVVSNGAFHAKVIEAIANTAG